MATAESDALERHGRPRRALVLSGGGARGAYEAGVVAGLCEREQFDIICGTSIGAINAALAAQGATDRLREIWRSVPQRAMIRGVSPFAEIWTLLRSQRGIGFAMFRQLAIDLERGLFALRYAHPRVLRRLSHLLDPAPIAALLHAMLDFAALQRTLIVGVTNLSRARPEAFHAFAAGDATFRRAFEGQETASVRLTAENYVTSILASAAIPLAFPKVAIADDDGQISDYVDGGIGNNTPIRQAIDAGADEITVVIADHIALRDHTHRADTLGSIALVAQDILQQQVLELDLKLARRVNESVLLGGAPGKRFVRIRTIGPTVAIPLPILGFADLETIDRAFEQGLIDGRGASDASGLERLFETDSSARAIRSGEALYREREVAREMYVVTAGEFELTFMGRPIRTFVPGDIVGELNMLDSGARRASVFAKTDGSVVPIGPERFHYLVQFAPSFALVVLRSLAALLRTLDETVGLASVKPLAGVDGASRTDAASLCDDMPARSFAKGETIFRPGDPGSDMYVVIEGEVDVRRADGSSTLTARQGDVFGETALSDHRPRNTVATAMATTRVVPIDSLRFTNLVQSDPNFAMQVMRKMAERALAGVDDIDRTGQS